MPFRPYQHELEQLYRHCNRAELAEGDPVAFCRRFEDPADREVVALVSAGLAYGRVAQIMRSIERLLAVMGPAPARAVVDRSAGQWRKALGDWKHRFATAEEMADLLAAAGGALRRSGSMEAYFCAHAGDEPCSAAAGLAGLVDALRGFGAPVGHLLPHPGRGSACKRLHLMLRWLVRCDDVDPGGWSAAGPRCLIVPMDVHMHRISKTLGATRRSSPDARSAREVTEAFARLCPDDPVRYDFALTRVGIAPAAVEPSKLLRRLRP